MLNVTHQSPLTIVVADDEPPIRTMVADKLTQAGFVVHAAADGEEALELTLEHNPVCIVTDLQMPVMNGYELCCRLRTNSRTAMIPALLLTARGHVLNDDMLKLTSIKRVMSKPFGLRELVSYVQSELVEEGLRARKRPAVKPADPTSIQEAA